MTGLKPGSSAVGSNYYTALGDFLWLVPRILFVLNFFSVPTLYWIIFLISGESPTYIPISSNVQGYIESAVSERTWISMQIIHLPFWCTNMGRQ